VDVDEVGHGPERDPVVTVPESPAQDQAEHGVTPQIARIAEHIDDKADRYRNRSDQEENRPGRRDPESSSRVVHVGNPHEVVDDRDLRAIRNLCSDQALCEPVDGEDPDGNRGEGDVTGSQS
jgi:hypothetical protein